MPSFHHVDIDTVEGIDWVTAEVVISHPDRARHQHARVRVSTTFARPREDGSGPSGTIRRVAEKAIGQRGYAIVPPPPGVSIEWWCPVKHPDGLGRWEWSVEAPVEKVYA